jgi:hypothetical protein
MMIIYVVISAILLYLYYLKKDIAIFGAFVVVIFEIFRLKGTGSGYEGFNIGNSGNDKECAKYGFSKPNIKDEDSFINELQKTEKIYKKNVNNFLPVTDKELSKDVKIIFDTFLKNKEVSKFLDKRSVFVHASLYLQNTISVPDVGIKDMKNLFKKMSDLDIAKITEEGEQLLKEIIDIGKQPEIKNGSKKIKKMYSFIKCLCSHWLSIWKNIQENFGKSSGDSNADKEESEKKKGDDE